MSWTKDRIELLKKLWAEGHSAAQIARKMGDVTRSAVIGKVHRLNLSSRKTTSRAQGPRRPRLPKPKPKPVVAEPAPIEAATLGDGEHVTVLTLKDHMCKWPIGEPGTPEFHFCGHFTGKGETYCDDHVALAYVAPKRRVSNNTHGPYKTKYARFR